MSAINYRAEVDGLRAIAVVPVVMFHAGIGLFAGGFVGVDVFFVISGYLITSIILADINKGSFSLLSFYERRARRILPALLFMAAICVPFAWFLMIPVDLKGFSDSLSSVTVYLSNFLFWRQSGYFEQAAELKPLLHTWSLAVEEQYYLFFPLSVMIIYRFCKNYLVHLLLLASVVSLFYADWASINRVSSNFYLLPSRIWELLAGAIAAYIITKNLPLYKIAQGRLTSELGSFAGLLLIVLSIVTFTRELPFPSFYTIVPVLGTVLIVFCANSSNVVGRVLSLRPLVFLGLISYSTYLWHQPIFAFTRHYTLIEHSNLLQIVLIIVAVLLGFLSWKYVEQPFRNRKKYTNKKIWTLSFAVSAVLLVVGLVISKNDGFDSRLSENDKLLSTYLEYNYRPHFKAGTCFLLPQKGDRVFAESCSGSLSADNTRVLLWGESHAAALSSGLRGIYSNLSQYTSSNCPPVTGVYLSKNPQCQQINETVISRIKDMQPDTVYLHANWNAYTKQGVASFLADSIRKIKSVSGKSKVYVVGGIAQWSSPLPVVMMRNELELSKANSVESPKLEGLRHTDTEIQGIVNNTSATFVSVLDAICNDGSGCVASVQSNKGYEPLVFDYGHLTTAGSSFIARLLADRLP